MSVLVNAFKLRELLLRRSDLYKQGLTDVGEFLIKEKEILLEEVEVLKSTLAFYNSQNELVEIKDAKPTKSRTENIKEKVKVSVEKPKEAKQKETHKVANDQTNVCFSKLNFRIGQIKEVINHPDAEKCFVEKVDFGDGNLKTVVSGLNGVIPIETLMNRKAMFLCNLKPMKLRGILSEAMIMCASNGASVEVLSPPIHCEIGERVICPGYEGDPDSQLNPKHKIWETLQPKLRVNANGTACFDEIPIEIKGKGQIVSKEVKECMIK